MSGVVSEIGNVSLVASLLILYASLGVP